MVKIENLSEAHFITMKNLVLGKKNIEHEFNTFRTNRISSLYEKIPKVMMHLIAFMSAAITIPLFFLKLPIVLWLTMNMLVVVCILYIYLVIRDKMNLHRIFGAFLIKNTKNYMTTSRMAN